MHRLSARAAPVARILKPAPVVLLLAILGLLLAPGLNWLLKATLLVTLVLLFQQRPAPVARAGRRAALQLLAVNAAGLLGWLAAGRLAAASPSRQSSARSGARLASSFSGNRFPVAQGAWRTENPPDPDAYHLHLEGAVAAPSSWSYPDLLALPAAALVATLDCTQGWQTTQTWQGIPLRDLLATARPAPGAAFVRLESQAGFVLSLPLAEAGGIFLATGVGGEPLAAAHGFPLRAIVPTQPGWSWLKGLVRIEVIAPQAGRPGGGSHPGDMALGAYTLGEATTGNQA